MQKIDIRYHDPYERLWQRMNFNSVLLSLSPQNKDFSFDAFALFDAVWKRGGYDRVCQKKYWDLINTSFLFSSPQELPFLYEKELKAIQEKLLNALPYERKKIEQNKQNKFIQVYSIVNQSNWTYDLTFVEKRFATKICFKNFDEYLNLKTLAVGPHQKNKIPVIYADKFSSIYKWNLFFLQTEPKNQMQLQFLRILNIKKNILIVEGSLFGLALAQIFTSFGVKVTLVIKNYLNLKYIQHEQNLLNSFKRLCYNLFFKKISISTLILKVKQNPLITISLCTISQIQLLENKWRIIIDKKTREFDGVIYADSEYIYQSITQQFSVNIFNQKNHPRVKNLRFLTTNNINVQQPKQLLFNITFNIDSANKLAQIINLDQQNRLFSLLPILFPPITNRIQALLDYSVYICGTMLDLLFDVRSIDSNIKKLFFQANNKQKKQQKQKNSLVLHIKKQNCQQKFSKKNKIKQRSPATNKNIVNFTQEKTQDTTIQPKQNKKDLFLAEDIFGIKHQKVVEYQKNISEKLFYNNSIGVILKFSQNSKIETPLMLNEFLQLYSLGDPFLTTEKGLISKTYILKNFVSRRQSISVHRPNCLTVYYQCLLIINGRSLFVIIDQTKTDCFYFHPNHRKMNQIITQYLLQVPSKFICLSSEVIRSLQAPAPIELQPYSLQQKITQQLKLYPSVDFNQLLLEKLDRAKELYIQNNNKVNFGSIKKIVFSLLDRQNKIQNNMTFESYLSLLADKIIFQINSYLNQILDFYCMTNLSLSQLFVGKINAKYIIYSLLKSQQNKFLPLKVLQTQYSQIYESIKQIFQQKEYKLVNELQVICDTTFIASNRIFLSFDSSTQFMYYTYLHNLSSKTHTLASGPYSQSFDDLDALMHSLVRHLLIQQNFRVVVKAFQRLICQQFLTTESYPKIILEQMQFLYGKRQKQINNIPIAYNNIKQDLEEQMKKGKVYFFEDDIVYVIE